MRPSVITLAVVFILVGAGCFAWGWLGLPSPTWLAAGAVHVAIGVGLVFRLRAAHRAGVVVSGAEAGWGAYSLWQLWAGGVGLAWIAPIAATVIGGSLLAGLLAVRAQFAPATPPSDRSSPRN